MFGHKDIYRSASKKSAHFRNGIMLGSSDISGQNGDDAAESTRVCGV
jgi:hypothetical protein